MAGRKRKTLYIERAFQLRLILKMVGIIAVGMAFAATCLYLFGNYQLDRMYASAHFDLSESWNIYRQAVLAASLISIALMGAAAVLFTLRESHKVAGPLHRFRLNMERVAEGDLSVATRLRASDELKPIADSMNAMTDALRERVVALKTAQVALTSEIAAARGGLESSGALAGGAKLDEIEERCAEVSALLSAFKVEQ